MVPLISCIMPTRNRRPFIEQTIKYFQAQDYLNAELIIIDDGEDKVADLVPYLDSIRYVSISEPCTIGMKRNLACSLAKGEIICHWDDDDYYGPHRLSRQAEPILQGKAHIITLYMESLLNVRDGILRKCPPLLHDRLFPYGGRAGTLMYQTRIWGMHQWYENRNTGEDVAFLAEALQWYDYQVLFAPYTYICVRHGSNVTSDLDMSDWEQLPIEQYLSQEDSAFYGQFRKVSHETAKET